MKWLFPLVSILALFSCNDDEVLPPSKLQGVSAIAGDGHVIISWNNTSSAISYNIYWSETAGLTTENGTLISNIASPYIHTGRIFGATYYYIVTAVNEAGESPASDEVSATLSPMAPINVGAFISGDSIIITWDKVLGANNYNIYWSESSGVSPLNGTKISDIESPFSHFGLTVGVTYYYIVTANNETGEGLSSDEISLTLNPNSPSNINIALSGDNVIVSWVEEIGVQSYNLYWSKSAGVDKSSASKISNVLSPFIHSDLTNGVTYYYIVTAQYSAGESMASDEVSIVFKLEVPINVSAMAIGDNIRISWDNISSAQSYNIYWSLSSGVTSSNGTQISSVESPYTHSGLSFGLSYYYIVTAQYASSESEASVEVIGLAGVPLIITDFTLKVSTDSSDYYISNDFTLSWTEANDFCNLAGGHMVTISNQEENDLVLNIQDSFSSKPHIWIGFTDETSEGNYVWVTSESITFTNWHPGQPSNEGPDDDYTIIHSTNHGLPGSWGSQFNSVNRYPVILEISK